MISNRRYFINLKWPWGGMSGPFCVYFLKYYVVAASADIQSFESMQFFHITPYAFFKRMVLQSADTKIRPFQH